MYNKLETSSSDLCSQFYDEIYSRLLNQILKAELDLRSVFHKNYTMHR